MSCTGRSSMGALGKKMMKTGTEPASSPKKGTAHAGWCLPPPPTRSWAQEHRGEETQRLADSKSHFLSAASLGTEENTSLSLFSFLSSLSDSPYLFPIASQPGSLWKVWAHRWMQCIYFVFSIGFTKFAKGRILTVKTFKEHQHI